MKSNLCLLLVAAVCLFSSILAEAQISPSLEVVPKKKGKALDIAITPSSSALGCIYEVQSAKNSSQLIAGKGKLIAVSGGESGESKFSAEKLGLLFLKGKPKQRIFFRATLKCGSEISQSDIKQITLKKSPNGKVAGFAKWLNLLQKRLANTKVSIVNAFPNLSFTSPVDLEHAGDGSNRLFVVEQGGFIRVFNNDSSTASSQLFLDVSSLISTGGERGLLSIAFHPNYESNGYFFIHYTDLDGSTQISRFSVNMGNSNEADPNSELSILNVPQPFANHNGGEIAFGPDGYLYIALGDGGSGGDPEGNGQKLSTLLGAILRVNIDISADGNNYSIPGDNPFSADVGILPLPRREIFAYGLRNPYKFSFDPYSGRIWAADVGQNALEEIDIIEKGGNYGWNIMEGKSCYPPGTQCNKNGLILPVVDYPHTLGSSVTGGYVYSGASVPKLATAYIFGDFISGRIFSLRVDGFKSPLMQELVKSPLNISSFGVDQSGELYVVAYGGTIHKFSPTN